MRSLYLRIWITVVAALALFAFVAGWMVQRHLSQERTRYEQMAGERLSAWGELLQRSLPAADEPHEAQAAGLRELADRLRLPMALDGADGRRIATSDAFAEREADMPASAFRAMAIRLDDGRTLRVVRRPRLREALGVDGGPRGPPPWRRGGRADADHWSPLGLPDLPGLPDGVVMLALLALLFAAVAAGAWPVVRRLTRRLEGLQRGVEAFGAGALDRRVVVEGRDEVAALAESFNRAAGRIEALVRSHQSLLANASHELRSPLARLKMALAMLDDAPPARRVALAAEIATNIGELDGLVEEVLLASRLDAAVDAVARDPVDLLAMAAEEAARVGAVAEGQAVVVPGDERLLRRAVRNLLDNARRYGGTEAGGITVTVASDDAHARIDVCDRGPGVPEALRERIFEPFFRLPGHAEREGGVGLGLALVRQIATRHGGQVRCTPRDGGGGCFSLALPVVPARATVGATSHTAASSSPPATAPGRP